MCVVYHFFTYRKWFFNNLDMANKVPVSDDPSFHNWDPKSDKSKLPLLPSASMRIKKDLMSLYKDPPPGIFATANESDMRDIHALIIGPMDTPYEGGMFYFYLKCPYDFPIKPPKVRFMTTDAGKVRFNPNLYSGGKVCLSIIGTWTGPGWTPAQQLSSLLISIQSLMNENPITNEPGFEKEFRPSEAAQYSDMITYQTIRVAVLGMVLNECKLNIPTEFLPIIERTFLQYYDIYVEICNKKKHLDGRKYKDPLNPNNPCTYNYQNLLIRLKKTKEKIINKMKAEKEKRGKQMGDGDGDISDYKDEDDDEDMDEQIDENNVQEFLDMSNASSSSFLDEEIESIQKEELYYSAEESDEGEEAKNLPKESEETKKASEFCSLPEEKMETSEICAVEEEKTETSEICSVPEEKKETSEICSVPEEKMERSEICSVPEEKETNEMCSVPEEKKKISEICLFKSGEPEEENGTSEICSFKCDAPEAENEICSHKCETLEKRKDTFEVCSCECKVSEEKKSTSVICSSSFDNE